MKHLFSLCFFLVFFSCKNEWTEKERQDFEKDCSKKTHFEPGNVCFTGFKHEDIDTITIIEKSNSVRVDSFTVYANTINNLDKPDNNEEYWAYIDRRFNIKHNYEFHLGEDKPYILKDMEMIMWAQYTMKGEAWGCEMGNYTIDNEKFEHVGNIYFKKRGFKHKWE